MISVRISESAQLATHLAAQVRKLALARAETRRRGPGRWRVASLLWPLFAGER